LADPRVDPKWLRAAAKRAGFFQDSFERAYRLGIVLQEIGRSEYLASRLVLKGGTAINFFHAEMPRLSVDADLNYIGQVDREAMMAERPQVLAAIDDLGKSLGYARDVVVDDHAGWSVRLRYQNAHGGGDAVKLDVNFLMRVPLFPVARRPLPTVFELEGAGVPVLALEEVYGGKLKALAVRAAPRDVFDAAHFFAEGPKHNAQRLRKAFLFHAFLDDSTLRTVNLGAIERLGERDYRDTLAPVLRRGAKVLAGDLGTSVLPPLRQLLDLNAEEREFGRRLEAHEYEPSLLFADLKVDARIALHPAAEWRRRNPHGRLGPGV
jgi:predicted nucleotidyltransferase component of viral defense system